MGTNYYLYEDACPHCGRSDERKHIGKSSAGWVFALHVIPDDGIHDLPDWIDRWSRPNAVIKDEYGKPVAPNDMLLIILARVGRAGKDHEPEWLAQNQAVAGPFGLVRCAPGRHCLRHGAGTYDLHTGDFS